MVEPIDDEAGTGRIKVEGMDWSARTTDGSKLPEGVKVKVKAIAGVKLMVSPSEKRRTNIMWLIIVLVVLVILCW